MTSYIDGNANFIHFPSLNIGESLSKDIFEMPSEDNSYWNNGITDMVSEGYFGIFLVGRYTLLMNWLNLELLELKQF